MCWIGIGWGWKLIFGLKKNMFHYYDLLKFRNGTQQLVPVDMKAKLLPDLSAISNVPFKIEFHWKGNFQQFLENLFEPPQGDSSSGVLQLKALRSSFWLIFPFPAFRGLWRPQWPFPSCAAKKFPIAIFAEKDNFLPEKEMSPQRSQTNWEALPSKGSFQK